MSHDVRPWIAGIVLTALAGTAFAGELRRLAIELPPDIAALEPGERLDVVQVVRLVEVDADLCRAEHAQVGVVECVEFFGNLVRVVGRHVHDDLGKLE